MFKIGDFSKITRVTIKTLRYYDRIGLLKPSFIDEETGYRYYAEEQTSQIYAILSYKKAGLSSSEIKKMLSVGSAKKEFLLVCKNRLEKEAVALKEQIQQIEQLLQQTEERRGGVTLKDIPAYKTCYVRGYVENSSKIPAFIKNCHLEFLRSHSNLRFPEPDYCCIIYPHDEYRESNVFVEYVQRVEEFGEETEIVKFKRLEPVRVIGITHFGSYDTLSEAYLQAVEWAGENGYTLRGDVRERYIHGAWDREKESEWETEVQLPVCIKEEK